VRASKWLRSAKVQAYLAELTAEAEAKANKERLAAVASLQEVLEHLTAIVRAGHMGQYLRRTDDGGLEPDYEAIRSAPPGAVSFRQGTKGSWSISLDNTHRAANALIAYYTGRLGER